MQIKDIIKKRRKELNLTYEELGNMCGVGKTTVRKWELGLTENMKVDKIEQLSNALKISPLELLGYDSNFFNPTPNEPILVDKSPHVEEPKKLVDFYPNKKTNQIELRYETLKIQIYKEVANIPLNHIRGREFNHYITSIPNPYDEFNEDLFGLEMMDHSMNRIIPKGTYAIIKSIPFSHHIDKFNLESIKNGSIVCVFIDEQNAILRKFFKVDNMFILKPESYDTSYEPSTFVGEQRENIYIIGEVIGFVSPLLVGIESDT